MTDAEEKPKATVMSVAVSSGVGCKRCGCRPRAALDDLCAPCRAKVGGKLLYSEAS